MPHRLALLVTQHEQIKALDLLARPGRLAQELEAGFDAGVVGEAADGDELAEALPAVFVDQGLE